MGIRGDGEGGRDGVLERCTIGGGLEEKGCSCAALGCVRYVQGSLDGVRGLVPLDGADASVQALFPSSFAVGRKTVYKIPVFRRVRTIPLLYNRA